MQFIWRLCFCVKPVPKAGIMGCSRALETGRRSPCGPSSAWCPQACLDSEHVRRPRWADGSSGQLLKGDGTIHLPRGWRACGEPRSAPGPVPRTTPLSPRCPGGHSWLWNAAPGPEGTGGDGAGGGGRRGAGRVASGSAGPGQGLRGGRRGRRADGGVARASPEPGLSVSP